MPSVLALVPARGGSERVPGKNVRTLSGKPLIAYTVEAALRASAVDRVIVSTDSSEIAEAGRAAGAEVPFMRPAEIAGSTSTEMEFLLHALDWLRENEGQEPELIAILYPTSPLRTPESIDVAVRLLQEHPEADSLRSVRPCSEHPYKMWVEEDGYLKPFVSEPGMPNAHTLAYKMLPPVYIQTASIYITRPGTVREKGSPTGDVIVPFVMDEVESVDVNTPLDFALAEMLMANRKNDGR